MIEGELSSSKSEVAAAFTLLSPTPSTTELPVRCLNCCETSFAPEQQLSSNTGTENLNIFNYDITVCPIFTVNPLLFELSRLSKDQSSNDSIGVFFFKQVKKDASSPVWELQDKVSQLHALEGHGLPPDTTAGAIHQCLKKGNKCRRFPVVFSLHLI